MMHAGWLPAIDVEQYEFYNLLSVQYCNLIRVFKGSVERSRPLLVQFRGFTLKPGVQNKKMFLGF